MGEVRVRIFERMMGKTITNIIGGKGDDAMVFTSSRGDVWRFYHEQDCCECVLIEDIAGDIEDLIGSPIVLAEEVSSAAEPLPDVDDESHTWTFYRFATPKGSVTVRWLGTSNGYYSESVSVEETSADDGAPPTPRAGEFTHIIAAVDAASLVAGLMGTTPDALATMGTDHGQMGSEPEKEV